MKQVSNHFVEKHEKSNKRRDKEKKKRKQIICRALKYRVEYQS